METVKISIYSTISSLSNDELRLLLKETKLIGNADVPKSVKRSKQMKALFDLEKTDYYNWGNQYSNIRRAIENEILYRILKDQF